MLEHTVFNVAKLADASTYQWPISDTFGLDYLVALFNVPFWKCTQHMATHGAILSLINF